MVEDWSKCLKPICNGYETGLFYRALPTTAMAVKGNDAKGGKKSKERVSVLLACSAAREKWTTFVTAHSAKPRCSRGLASPLCLLVTYSLNRKVWTTVELFQQWLDRLNGRTNGEGRSVLLFVGNCTAHPDVICSNVQLVLLLPNATSELQPRDAGIIQSTIMHYRKLLLHCILFTKTQLHVHALLFGKESECVRCDYVVEKCMGYYATNNNNF